MLVPCSSTIGLRDVCGTLRVDCLQLMSTKVCDKKLGSLPDGGEVVGYDTVAQASAAQMSRLVMSLFRSRHNYMISFVPMGQPVGALRGALYGPN